MAGQESLQLLLSTAKVLCVWCYMAHRIHCGPFTQSSALAQINTLRTGDADLHLYAYEQFKYPVPNVLIISTIGV
jgi:hypothetical protein